MRLSVLLILETGFCVGALIAFFLNLIMPQEAVPGATTGLDNSSGTVHRQHMLASACKDVDTGDVSVNTVSTAADLHMITTSPSEELQAPALQTAGKDVEQL